MSGDDHGTTGECGAIPPNVRGPVPCHLAPGHEGQHFSTSGCAGSEIRWDDHGTTGELDLDAIERWARSAIGTFRERQQFVEDTRAEIVPALVTEVRRLRRDLRHAYNIIDMYG